MNEVFLRVTQHFFEVLPTKLQLVLGEVLANTPTPTPEDTEEVAGLQGPPEWLLGLACLGGIAYMAKFAVEFIKYYRKRT